MGSKRTRRLLASIGCAVAASIAMSTAAHATESAQAGTVPAQTLQHAEGNSAPSGTLFNEAPAAKVNVPFTHQFTFAGNAKSILAEHLPPGLSMDPTGLVTGLPTEANPDSIVKLAAFDWNTMQLVEQWVPLPVADNAPVITSAPPLPFQNRAFSYQVTANAPADTSSLTFTASGLPTGYSISADGLITGSPEHAEPGKYTITVTATAHPSLPGRVQTSTSVSWTLEIADHWFDDRGSYHRVLFDDIFSALPIDKLVHGDCPAGMWLDSRAGTPGKNVGRGFVVDTSSSLTTFTKSGHTRYRSHPSGQAAGGLDIRVGIDWFADPWAFVRMTCTADPAFAWDGK